MLPIRITHAVMFWYDTNVPLSFFLLLMVEYIREQKSMWNRKEGGLIINEGTFLERFSSQLLYIHFLSKAFIRSHYSFVLTGDLFSLVILWSSMRTLNAVGYLRLSSNCDDTFINYNITNWDLSLDDLELSEQLISKVGEAKLIRNCFVFLATEWRSKSLWNKLWIHHGEYM